jgi:predicted enzyme related to lactoylglutathione lyase
VTGKLAAAEEHEMNHGVKTIIYPVRDVAAARAIYSSLLGAGPAVDQPYYTGFQSAGQDIGLDPNGHAQGMTGPVPYWHVDDIEATLATLLAAGATVVRPVSDVGGGRRIATLADVDGNPIGLLQG